MVVILEFKCLHFLHLAIYCDDDHGNDVQKTKTKKKKSDWLGVQDFFLFPSSRVFFFFFF